MTTRNNSIFVCILVAALLISGCVDQQPYLVVQGPRGPAGSNGSGNGTASTIDVNYTFTGAPGTSALVTNIGNNTAAKLNFLIPAGANGANGADGANGTPGAPGAPGAAATITINATFTGNAGTSASVTNIGNANAANFNFVIPSGLTGLTGPTGPMNQTINLTANMTANNTAGPAGPPGTTDMSWNATYPLLSGIRTLTGIWNLGGFNLSNLGAPAVSTDAATKGYVDTAIAGVSGGSADMSWNVTYPLLSGVRTLTGKWNAGGFNFSNIGPPVVSTDAATKAYVDAFPSFNGSYQTIVNDSTFDEMMNTSMRNNISINFYTKTASDVINTSMRNNISAFYSTTVQDATQDEAINTSMRNNISMQYTRSKCGAATSISNGSTITHGFGAIPTWAMVTGTNLSQDYGVVARGATTITVYVRNQTAGRNGAADTVYWCVG